MKSTFILFAFFVLVAITPHLPTITAEVVFDTEGNVMRNPGTYYILPIKGEFGGGIELVQSGADTCPLTVAASRIPFSDGLPIDIISPYRIAIIYEGLPFELLFNNATADLPSCIPTPPRWNAVKDELTEGRSIKLSDDTTKNSRWFSIQSYEHHANSYQLAFHSMDDDAVRGIIGIEFDNEGNKRLVLTNENNNNHPLVVQFKLVEPRSSVAT